MKVKSIFGYLLLCFVLLFALSACSSATDEEPTSDEFDTETFSNEELDQIFNTDDSSTDSPYTKEELENDPSAPSTNPNDYNADGEYVPADGPTDNPADYNADGEYKPVDEMTQEEIEQELNDMLNGN